VGRRRARAAVEVGSLRIRVCGFEVGEFPCPAALEGRPWETAGPAEEAGCERRGQLAMTPPGLRWWRPPCGWGRWRGRVVQVVRWARWCGEGGTRVVEAGGGGRQDEARMTRWGRRETPGRKEAMENKIVWGPRGNMWTCLSCSCCQLFSKAIA